MLFLMLLFLLFSASSCFSSSSRYSSQHQFWVPNEVEEEVENPELSAQMKSRYITFAGRFTPVTHSCRAPLSNGALCERQDRVKVRHTHTWKKADMYSCLVAS